MNRAQERCAVNTLLASTDRAPAAAPAKAELRGEISSQPAWLTEVVAATLHAERGTVKQLAAELGVADRRVYDVADRHNPRSLRASWLPAITHVTGSFAVLDAIERRVGRVAFSAITVDDSDDLLQQALAREVAAFGESLTEIANDMADGRIDPGELDSILKGIDRLLARTCEFRAMVVDKARLDAAAVIR